jgi:hypothetical protein
MQSLSMTLYHTQLPVKPRIGLKPNDFAFSGGTQCQPLERIVSPAAEQC